MTFANVCCQLATCATLYDNHFVKVSYISLTLSPHHTERTICSSTPLALQPCRLVVRILLYIMCACASPNTSAGGWKIDTYYRQRYARFDCALSTKFANATDARHDSRIRSGRIFGTRN